MMKILLSNDDGINALGIQKLASILRKKKNDVQIIAPDRNKSGSSSAFTLDKPLRINKFKNGDISVEGTPADCVYLGINKLIRPCPDIVISGINQGPNLGDDVIYSGTVAAAIEGRHLKFPALAVSLNGKKYYETAAKVICNFLKLLIHHPLTECKILNINVPNIPFLKIKGYKITRCGTRYAAQKVYKFMEPRGGEFLYWLGPIGNIFDESSDTDFAAIQNGYVSITPLNIDLTDYKLQVVLKKWFKNIKYM
ncbi:MAG: 5'/3'-nucleotidase SurE [Arsenophonus sp.]|nr:MAG: 5'/3'-nucleotidase SurE [Arsenophonus sp.]